MNDLLLYGFLLGGFFSGFLIAAAYIRRPYKRNRCIDCGDKIGDICADCLWKLNGEMQELK